MGLKSTVPGFVNEMAVLTLAAENTARGSVIEACREIDKVGGRSGRTRVMGYNFACK